MIKGAIMKNRSIFILGIVSILFLTACGEDTQKSASKAIENPVNKYMDSRLNALDIAKQSVKESNKRTKEQNEVMKALNQ